MNQMNSRFGFAALAFVFALHATPVVAQNLGDEGMIDSSLAAIPPADGNIDEGGFELLSAGNRKIALALFDAQGSAAGNDVAWTLDEIAGAKRSGIAWSELFTRMRAEGLIDAPDLGSVISGAVRKWNAPVRVNARGNRAPVARRGAYKTLSGKDRGIAEALFEIQTIGKSGRHAWSLDQIGAARQNGVRWSEVLKRLRADGLIRARTLDRVMRRHARLAGPSLPARKVVVTNGDGRHVVFTTRSRR